MTKNEQFRLTHWRFKVLQTAGDIVSVARTCRHSGISRNTNYKWRRRLAAAASLSIAWVTTGFADSSAPAKAGEFEPKVVLVTFDGVRWQDLFRGADAALIKTDVHEDFREHVSKAYGSAGSVMPFLHGVIAKQGVLIGNRDAGECADVLNDMWFSYPGYTEMLAGKPNPAIVENDPLPNPHVTVLEWANKRPEFAGKVEMVGTWNLFPYIVNAERSGVPVNAALNGQVGTDVRTGRAGLELLAGRKPRLIHIAFGDTDEYAHNGNYEAYLSSMERGDEYLRQLWLQLQDDPYYSGQTTLIVSTDHGRGHEPPQAWHDHSGPRYHALNPDYQPQYNGKGVTGSNEIWIAALGPAVTSEGRDSYRNGHCVKQAQIAKSIVVALGGDPDTFTTAAAPPFAFIVAPKP